MTARPVRSDLLTILVLLVLAALGVGVLGLTVARVAGWPARWAVAGLSAGFYGVLAVSLLTVHWVAAANSPLLVLFTTLLLASWLAASAATAGKRLLLLAVVPCLLIVALLSKESAILMLICSLFAGASLRRGEWLVLVSCVVLAVGGRNALAGSPGSYRSRALGGGIRAAVGGAAAEGPAVGTCGR